ncbi:MAG: hypothetical protein K6G92_07415 [Bacteroidaceae bacterium]|nr:hypothetical protein [Bacteroidaceae bacterium]
MKFDTTREACTIGKEAKDFTLDDINGRQLTLRHFVSDTCSSTFFFEECIPDAYATPILFPEKKQAHSIWNSPQRHRGT